MKYEILRSLLRVLNKFDKELEKFENKKELGNFTGHISLLRCAIEDTRAKLIVELIEDR